MVYNLFVCEILEQQKQKMFFSMREQNHLWWIRVQTGKAKANKGHVHT